MLYSIFLFTHSLFRWVVLAGLVYAIIVAFRGWRGDQAFTPSHNRLQKIVVRITEIQLLLGLVLYFISPVIKYFMDNFGEAVKDQATRFFGMEHISMMIIAVTIVSITSAVAKRKATDRQKFKAIAIGFTIGLVIILVMIPWPFSPMAARPFWRGW
ncbi:MAG: hypothetical protein SF052_04165 [Bacteroidia bacterium]|nr:hypothetical protein [Bacteroidia bacterium]